MRPGAIYTAFEDLDELILRVNSRTLAQLETSLATPTEGAKKGELARLAFAYLRYARENEQRWRALFEHRLPPEKPLPHWYAQDRDRLFGLLEAPLAELLPRQELSIAAPARANPVFSGAWRCFAWPRRKIGADPGLDAGESII